MPTFTRFFVLMMLAVVMLVGLAQAPPQPAAAQAGQSLPRIDMRPDCKLTGNSAYTFLIPDTEVVGETVTCGQLLTYEIPSDTASAVISNPFVVLQANNGNPTTDPIIYFSGGPGSSAILAATEWIDSPLREARDIILIEQRGAGYSFPSLNCFTYESNSDRDCIRLIEQNGVNLANYNTSTNAADIVSLMTELATIFDYDSYNLYGISYGTRLGLEVMRQAGPQLRSVVLDSSYPPNADWMEMPLNAQRAFNTLFAYCAADAACAAAYPTLEADFYEVVYELNATPLDAGWTDYDGADFINDLYFAMYRTAYLPGLPAVIDLYKQGRYDEADNLLYDGPPGVNDVDYLELYDAYPENVRTEFFSALYTLQLSADMYAVFMCNEVYSVSELQTAIALAERADIDTAMFESQLSDLERGFDLCDTWSFDAATVLGGAVASDVPTLVLAGDFDPITPPRWGKLAAEALVNSYFFTFPGVGHAVIDGGECPVSVVMQFIATPDTAPDASCRADMQLEFYYPQ